MKIAINLDILKKSDNSILSKLKELNENGHSLFLISNESLYKTIDTKKNKKEVDLYLGKNKDLFDEYRQDYFSCVNGDIPEETLKAIAVMRFQITILQLCINGILSLDDKEWKIAIKNKEITGYEKIAIDDVFLWLKNLCTLAGLEYKEPIVYIQQTTQLDSVSSEYVKLDFSILLI